jgi:hypothetical protein
MASCLYFFSNVKVGCGNESIRRGYKKFYQYVRLPREIGLCLKTAQAVMNRGLEKGSTSLVRKVGTLVKDIQWKLRDKFRAISFQFPPETLQLFYKKDRTLHKS